MVVVKVVVSMVATVFVGVCCVGYINGIIHFDLNWLKGLGCCLGLGSGVDRGGGG